MVRKNTKIKTLIFYLLLLIALTAGPPLAYEWHIESVDTDDNVGWCTSIAIDTSDKPHISYYDYYNDSLKYAYYDGSSWQIEYIPDLEEGGWFTSIALDTSDKPHISYYVEEAYLDGDLKYARYDGSSWHIETVDYAPGEVGTYSSIALDTSDKPHISYGAYRSAYGYNLKYAYYDGSSWRIETVDYALGQFDLDTSIALDTSDNPHISYSDDSNFDLKYAYYDGSYWQIETVDTEGSGTSITLDASDNPHISYCGAINGLKYAYYDGSSWQIESLDSAAGSDDFTFTSIALDTSDNPHISYYDYTNRDLKYAYFDGSSWQIETVDTVGDVGQYTSIALDAVGNPHISYFDYTNRDLKYAYAFENTPPSSFNLAQPPDGAEVPEPVTLDWEDSTDDDGHDITYDVWYAADPSFDPHDEVTELTESTYTFPEGLLTQGETYYWKVRAWDGYDETWSGPDPYWSFTVEDEVTDISVAHFSAESARTGVELTWECADPGVGFNLYRSEEATGMRTKSREMLNAELITGESPYSYLDAEVSDGVTYSYWLEAMDASGASETFGPVRCTAGTFVPSSYALYQSRPNPARGTAVIAFDLPEDADVTLTIYDLSGRKVMTSVNEALPAGAYERPVSGLAPGVYVYRLDAGEFNAVRKMVVIR